CHYYGSSSFAFW
nr:immunoglobulin heavy chain junction region [Mus musculus]